MFSISFGVFYAGFFNASLDVGVADCLANVAIIILQLCFPLVISVVVVFVLICYFFFERTVYR